MPEEYKKCLVGLISILKEAWLQMEKKLGKHKVDDVVTVDKKRDNNNDIQGPEEEDNEQQSTTNTVF